MSFPTLSTYKDLIARFPSWTDLKAYLAGPECALRVEDASSPESPYALIRAIKGASVLTNSDVRAFRSVIWDTLTHRPVSVTSWKSTDGESLPEGDSTAEYRFEMFNDGTLIGMFWDSYSERWRIHTRSILDAGCRYFSPTRTFASMFAEATRDLDHADLDRTRSYSWVLMHPENRIVCDAPVSRAVIADVCAIGPDGVVAWERATKHAVPLVTFSGPPTWDAVRARLAEWNTRFRHNCQGIVVKSDDGHRWKIRTAEYNRVRKIRGNSPRRDYLWLKHWVDGTLPAYLAVYPEERGHADAIINSWKTVTRDVYRVYCDVFKAHTLDKKMIPPKYRPHVYGLHKLYHEALKPAGEKVDWKTALAYMNGRDVPLMLFTLNWELRAATRALSVTAIPFEPPAVVTTTVEAEAEAPTEAVEATA
jgi:hypothetical protein